LFFLSRKAQIPHLPLAAFGERIHALAPRVTENVAWFLDIVPCSDTIKERSSPILEGNGMNIEIHDAALEARIQKQLETTGSSSVEEVLLHLLETQEEQDRWLLENRETINAKIRRGIDQLDRGQGIPEDQLDAHLAKLKSQK